MVGVPAGRVGAGRSELGAPAGRYESPLMACRNGGFPGGMFAGSDPVEVGDRAEHGG
jgi:hypothetical protein